MKSSVRSLTAWLCGVMLLLTAACGGGDSRERQEADSLALRVAVQPTWDCLPVYYAAQNGLFDSLGLKVDLRSLQSLQDIDTLLRNGGCTIAYSDLPMAVLRQLDSLQRIRVVAATQGRWVLLTDTAGVRRVYQLRQLEGRLVGVSRMAAPDYWSDRLTDTARMEQTAIYRPHVGDVRIRTDMLCNGTLDAALLPEPYATEARLRGRVALFHTDSLKPRLGAFVATAELTASHARWVELFCQAYDLAASRITHAPAATRDSLRSLLRTAYHLPDTLCDSVFGHWPTVKPLAAPRRSDAQAALDWLIARDTLRAEYRLISPRYSPDSLLWTTPHFSKSSASGAQP